ncbi:hypothetical protein Aab01nite_84360 [Paractinoplanes abujensis]|nr:hypothetical protein Aab01nite_84360 [Actinoplanes abujensis]
MPSDPRTVPLVPYFDEERLDVPADDTVPLTLIIEGLPLENARTFELAVTYRSEGAEHTPLIKRGNGEPFRATPSVCPWVGHDAGVARRRVQPARPYGTRGVRDSGHSYGTTVRAGSRRPGPAGRLRS